MRSVTYSMSVSLDGYIVGPDGGSTGRRPTPRSSASGSTRSGRSASTSWDDGCTRRCCTGRPPTRIPRSATPSSSGPRSGSRCRRSCSPPRCGGPGNARLASGGLAEEIGRLRAEPGDGDIAIGGATLAVEAAASGLIDEYRVMVYPVLVGGGIPFFPAARAPGRPSSSRPAPSARTSSTSITAWRGSRSSAGRGRNGRPSRCHRDGLTNSGSTRAGSGAGMPQSGSVQSVSPRSASPSPSAVKPLAPTRARRSRPAGRRAGRRRRSRRPRPPCW